MILIAVLGAAAFFWKNSAKSKEISSIAVLPFVNASNDPNSEYLSDGLTESLINNLSQVKNLAVMSRASVFHYKGKDVDPQSVARDLKVEAVVTGRMVQHGDQLIISSELIDARTNRNLWGDQYDRKVSGRPCRAAGHHWRHRCEATRTSGRRQAKKPDRQRRHRGSRGLSALSQGQVLPGRSEPQTAGKIQSLLRSGD